MGFRRARRPESALGKAGRAASGFSAVAAALSLGAGASGCAPMPICAPPVKVVEPVKVVVPQPEFVLVEHRKGVVSGFMQAPEITATPAYETRRGELRAVALRVPDNCLRRESNTGGANVSTSSLETVCGVPLQVLESVLSRAGYRVLSWSTLLGIEREQRVPVHTAAQQLGADFVIIINDMFVGELPAGGAAAASYRYFVSGPTGEKHRPKALYEQDRNWLKTFVRDRVGNEPVAQGTRTLQARLNATVVLAQGSDKSGEGAGAKAAAKAGEAIWFYNWSIGRLSKGQEGLGFLFAGLPKPDNSHQWWPVMPQRPEAAPPPAADRATSEEEYSSKAEVVPADAQILYRKVAEDFIKRFKEG